MPSDKPVSKASEHRRSNKPIMEKKRRARINNCLNELKNLLLEAMRKDPARHSKLEKADILEMTVRHLQHLQRQQMALAVAADPRVITKYRAGFNECAEEVSRYVGTLDGIDSPVKQRLLNHLANCINGLQGVMAAGPMSENAGAGNANSAVMSRLQIIPSRLPNGELALLLPNRVMANWPLTNQHLMSICNSNNAAVSAQAVNASASAMCTHPAPGQVFQQEKNFRRGRIPLEPSTLLTVNVGYTRGGAGRSSPSIADDRFSLSSGHSPDSCRSNSLSPSTSDCSDHGLQHPDLTVSCSTHSGPRNDATQLPQADWNTRFQNNGLRWNSWNNATPRHAELRTGASKSWLEKQQNISVHHDVEPELLMPVDLSKDADKMWRPW